MSSPLISRAIADLLGTVGLPAPTETLESPRDMGPYRVRLAAEALVSAAVHGVAAMSDPAIFHPRGPKVHVDADHAMVAFASERRLRSDRQTLPDLWHPLSGNFPAADGWIRLHANLRLHRRAALRVLDLPAHTARADIAPAVGRWTVTELDQAINQEGGVAAPMRTAQQWAQHPQAAVLARQPLVRWQLEAGYATPSALGDPVDLPPAQLGTAGRPLAGLRVVDLGRIIAVPVAGRFLAGWGADVHRIDAPDLEDGLLTELDTSFGKHRHTLDLRTRHGQDGLQEALAHADVVLHGFRPGVAERLRIDPASLARRAPQAVSGRLSAFGDDGPLGQRRGFDSVVQVATGIAHTCGFDRVTGPGQLPVQLLDHGAGHVIALAVLAALKRRRDSGQVVHATTSLARTGMWLAGLGPGRERVLAQAPDPTPYLQQIDAGEFGRLTYVTPPGRLGTLRPRYDLAPTRRTRI